MTSGNNTQPDDDSLSSGTSIPTIIACNSISILACLITLSIYAVLSMKAKYKRLMRRISLVVAACMASSDLVLHCSNLAGYGALPPGFVCAFVGGWLFAVPTMLSTFYSCTIALNSQIVFVFRRRSPRRALGFFILSPIIISFIIAFCALGTGVYGFDDTWGYCWYATQGVPASTVIVRMIFTYSLPTFLCMLYLIVAAVTISYAVFREGGILTATGSTATTLPEPDTPFDSNTSPPFSSTSTSPPHKPAFSKSGLAGLKEEVKRDRKPPNFSTKTSSRIVAATHSPSQTARLPKRGNSTGTRPSVHIPVEVLSRNASRRTVVMRQLTIRLIGYIVTPLLCLLPGIIFDLVTRVSPHLEVPTPVNALFDGLNGLIGLFNSALMLSDPALLAVWDDFRALVGRSTGEGEGEGESGTGSGRRRGGSSMDVLASGFGLGARTRIDEEEEGEKVEEVTGSGVEMRGVSNDSTQPISDETSGIQELIGGYPPRSDLRDVWGAQAHGNVGIDGGDRDFRQEDVRQHAGRGAEQGLEVHVRVDVTQEATERMSHIDQMEDWLDGL